MIVAAEIGNVEIVKELLSRGAKKEESKDDGATTLLVAAQFGNINVVEELIKCGANVDVKLKSDGVTPLFLAAQNGYPEIVRLLVKSGAQVLFLNLLFIIRLSLYIYFFYVNYFLVGS